MEVMTNPAISLLDQLRIEAQVLVPVLEALRGELGRERADELVTTAVRDWRREVIVRAGALMPGSPKERFEAFMTSSFQRIGEDVVTEVLKQESEALEIDIVGCRYADLFHALGEPGLGAAMACECDDHMADVVGPELEYTRTQTIMKGASCCDFRYRLTSDEDSKPDVDR
jgi:hypothetical protein